MEPLWGPWGVPNAAFFERVAGYGRSVGRWCRSARLRLQLTDAEVQHAVEVLAQYPITELEDLRAWAGDLLADLGVGLDAAVGDDRSVAYPSSLWEQNYWKRIRR